MDFSGWICCSSSTRSGWQKAGHYVLMWWQQLAMGFCEITVRLRNKYPNHEAIDFIIVIRGHCSQEMARASELPIAWTDFRWRRRAAQGSWFAVLLIPFWWVSQRIEPVITLSHFEMPYHLVTEHGGWKKPQGYWSLCPLLQQEVSQPQVWQGQILMTSPKSTIKPTIKKILPFHQFWYCWKKETIVRSYQAGFTMSWWFGEQLKSVMRSTSTSKLAVWLPCVRFIHTCNPLSSWLCFAKRYYFAADVHVFGLIQNIF